ncbi:MAG TPA: HlyD family efflux transporter periplasmic adaptor subunit [Planctomycetaceae bacterium]|nr:HlyD family efflux transporter periplasmic adaptor subunit [Planctomycetaceae bacterium]
MNPPRPAGPEGPPAAAQAAGQLLAEIADLAASPLPEPVFLQELLKRAVLAVGAEAGVVWMYDQERRLVLQCEVGLRATGFLEDASLRSAFEQPFAEVLRRGGVMAHDAEQATLRDGIRKRSALLGGLQRETDVAGLLHLFEAPRAPEQERPQRLRLVEQVCGLATRYWQQRTAQRGQKTPAGQTPAADQWSLAVHESLSALEVAVIAANESRRLLGIDRVTVAEKHGPRVKILAVTGQQSVNARSNVVRLLSRLAEQVVNTGEKFVFTGDTRNLPPHFETLLADYLHESRSRAIVVLPLAGPLHREASTAEAETRPAPKPQPVGALIVEQISETPLPADLEERLERVGAHVGLALRNAQSHERIFLLSLWEFFGNWRDKLKGRRLAQVGAGLALAAAVVLGLVLVPWNYRVVGKGRLMPVERRGIFAPWDGEVFALLVRSGQQVGPGDLLIRLKNEELEAKLLAQRNMLLEKQKQASAIRAQLSETETAQKPSTEIELRGKFVQLQIEIDGARQQVESLNRQVEAMSIRAPIAGVVATFRIEELLRERPVKRGELLLEVMDPAGSWRLELDVPENRLGHILRAQGNLHEARLPVRYVLATATESTYDGSLDSVSTRSVVSETEGAVVPLFASLAEPTPPAPRIGAEVIAKIDCGPKSLGYVLFGDVVEFVRKRFWF